MFKRFLSFFSFSYFFIFFTRVFFFIFISCFLAVNLQANPDHSPKDGWNCLENMVDLRSGRIFIQTVDCAAVGREQLLFKKHYLEKSWDFQLEHLAVHHLEKNEIKLFDGEFKLVFSSPTVAGAGGTIEDNHWWQTAKTKKKIKDKTALQQQALEQFYALKLIRATALEGIEFEQKDYAGRVDGKKEHLEIMTPQGRQLFYKAISQEKNTDLDELLTDKIYYLLKKEILPNGNVVRYSYDDKKRLSALETFNSSETKTFAWLHFTYYNPYLIDSDFDIYTSDGMILQYRLEKRKKRVFLKSLKSSHGLNESYSYFTEKNQSLLKEATCHGQTYAFEYYPLKSGHDFKIKTISLLKEDQLVPLYNLTYDSNYTEVFDSSGQKRIFYYDDQGRVSKIEYYTLKNQLSHTDRFIFSKAGKLLGKYRLDQNQKAFSALVFTYDKQGNLTSEQLVGNLSGEKSIPLKFQADGLPILGNVESHLKKWSYNSENQPVLEEDGLKRIEYSYDGDEKGKLCHKLISTPSKIEERFFYEYDSDGLLVAEIVDDGIAQKKENFQGVTERKIKRFLLKKDEPFYGCLEGTEEFYLDLETQEEKLLKKTLFTYSSKGRIENENIFGSDGQLAYSLKKSYDQFLHLSGISTISDSQSSLKTFGYNEKGKLIQKKTKKGTTEYLYNEDGLLIQKSFLGSDGKKSSCRKVYDIRGNLIEEEDTYQNKTKYTYDDFGHLIVKQQPSCVNEEGEEKDIFWKSHFDVWGRETATIDPLGRETWKFYNARDAVTKIVYPDQSEEHFFYNVDGSLKSQIDQMGIKTVYTYDSQKRLLKKEVFSSSSSLLLSESKEYNSFHLIREINALGRVKNYHYDFSGRLTRENEGERTIGYAYDALGHVCTKSISNQENSYVCHFKNDVKGQLLEERTEDLQGNILKQKKYERDWNVERILSDGCEEKFVYDSLGRLVRKENHFSYQRRGKGKQPEKPENLEQIRKVEITEYEYVENYQNFLNQKVLQTIKKKNGQQLIKTYDALGRLVQKESKEPLDKEELVYDLASCLRKKRKVSFNGSDPFLEECFYEYDAVGNLIRKKYLFPFFEKVVSFDYDPKGRQIKMTKPSGVTIEKSYDQLGYLTELKSSDGMIHYTFKHNLLGDLLESEDLAKNSDKNKNKNSKTVFVRNIFGEVVKESAENGLVLVKEFDLLGRRQKITLPDQSYLLFKWNPLHLEGSLRIENKQALYEHRFFDFDASGQWQRDSLLGGMDNLAYEFDLEGRKEKAKSSSFYQMINQQYSQSQSGVLSLLRNENGQIISKRTKEGVIEYEYDVLDRLIAEKTLSHRIVYSYDALNRKMSRVLYLLSSDGAEQLKSHERYLYEGEKEIGLWNTNESLLKLKVEGDLIGKEFQVEAESN